MHVAASRALFDDQVRSFSPQLAKRREWTFHAVEYPLVDCSFSATDRTTLRLRLACDDWNDLPPAISLQAPDGSAIRSLPANPTGVFHSGPHPLTGQPFICMRGTREYHAHPSHISDLWSNLRDSDSYTLGGILHQVWLAWLKGSG